MFGHRYEWWNEGLLRGQSCVVHSKNSSIGWSTSYALYFLTPSVDKIKNPKKYYKYFVRRGKWKIKLMYKFWLYLFSIYLRKIDIIFIVKDSWLDDQDNN